MKKETKNLIGKTVTVIGLTAALIFLLAKQNPEAKLSEPEINPNIISTIGTFHGSIEELTTGETLYHFKSDDDTVWWFLAEEEIGHIPEQSRIYTLTYDNGGTPERDLSICGCNPEWDCECHVYDDEFVKIERTVLK